MPRGACTTASRAAPRRRRARRAAPAWPALWGPGQARTRRPRGASIATTDSAGAVHSREVNDAGADELHAVAHAGVGAQPLLGQVERVGLVAQQPGTATFPRRRAGWRAAATAPSARRAPRRRTRRCGPRRRRVATSTTKAHTAPQRRGQRRARRSASSSSRRARARRPRAGRRCASSSAGRVGEPISSSPSTSTLTPTPRPSPRRPDGAERPDGRAVQRDPGLVVRGAATEQPPVALHRLERCRVPQRRRPRSAGRRGGRTAAPWAHPAERADVPMTAGSPLAGRDHLDLVEAGGAAAARRPRPRSPPAVAAPRVGGDRRDAHQSLEVGPDPSSPLTVAAPGSGWPATSPVMRRTLPPVSVTTVRVIFVEPAFPANQREFVRGLAEVGRRGHRGR